MAQPPLRSPIDPEELAAIFGVDDESLLDAPPPKTPRPVRRARRSVSLAERLRQLPRWVLFLSGLLIGWLVIGWVIWPVRWSNSDLWDLSTRNQKAVLQLVADRFWTDRDLAVAEGTLGSWDRDAVNTLLVSMQAEIVDPVARQHLDALSQALNLPGGEQSLLTSIFNQDGILIALGIAVLPMFIAVGLVVSTRLRAKPSQAATDDQLAQDEEAELEELLADVELETGQAGGPGPEGTGPDGQPPDQAGAPGEQQPGQAEAPEEKEEDDEEEEVVDANNPLGDLASLFAEEDTSVAQLELLCKGMPDVNVDELLTRSREILRRFREERRKPQA